MTKASLLAGTALAGALLLGPVGARPAHALDVSLGGFLTFEATAASGDRLDGDGADDGDPGIPDRGYQFSTDTEVEIRADGETDSGVRYGAKIELIGDQSETNNSDEAGLYFGGVFGRFELGADDGAEDTMYTDPAEIAAGSGGIDGDIPELVLGTNEAITDSSDAVKITYFTPRVFGFQAGVSYTPDIGDEGDNEDLTGDSSDDIEDHIGAGLNYEGAFGPAEVLLSGVLSYGNGEPEDLGGERGDDLESYAFGGIAGFGDLDLAASYAHEDELNESDTYGLGAAYDFGVANASFNFQYIDPEDDDDDLGERTIYIVSGDVGLVPGVSLVADLGLTDSDNEGTIYAAVGGFHIEF